MTNIDKKKLTSAIILGTICFIVVYLICIQYRTIEKIDVNEIETMREDELRTALAEWKKANQETIDEIENTKIKINEYKEKIESHEETGLLLEKDLKNAEMLLGLTDVIGHGIIITISNNEFQEITSPDLLDLINELNSAGAEAISINNQRIISRTDVFDVDNFIVVNEQRIVSPFVIKAIGDITYLQSALSIKNGYIDKYRTNGYSISMITNENIEINKYNGEIKYEYAK